MFLNRYNCNHKDNIINNIFASNQPDYNMSENTSGRNTRDDEIDLLDLFRRMGRTIVKWFSTLGRAVLISLVFIIKNLFFLGLSLIAGIAVAYLFWKKADSYYTSDMVLQANVKPVDGIISHVNRLNNYLLAENTDLLAEDIGLSQGQAKNILDIQAFWIIDVGNDGIPDYPDYSNKHNLLDTVNVRMDDRLNVRVRINVPQELSNVRNGIINYINSDPLIQKRNILRLKQNAELLARIDVDIHELDSLQKYKFFEESKNFIPGSGQMVFLQEHRTQLLYQDIYNLYTKKQKLELEQSLFTETVTVLSDFSMPSEEDNSITYYLKIFVCLFTGLTLLILIAFSNKRKIKEIYNKY